MPPALAQRGRRYESGERPPLLIEDVESDRADGAATGAGQPPRPQLENVRSFFEEHPVPTATRAISGALEKIRIHISRIEREGPQLSEWLAQWAVRHPASPPTDELPGALEATPAVTEPLTDLALTETASSSSNLAGSASVAD